MILTSALQNPLRAGPSLLRQGIPEMEEEQKNGGGPDGPPPSRQAMSYLSAKA